MIDSTSGESAPPDPDCLHCDVVSGQIDSGDHSGVRFNLSELDPGEEKTLKCGSCVLELTVKVLPGGSRAGFNNDPNTVCRRLQPTSNSLC